MKNSFNEVLADLQRQKSLNKELDAIIESVSDGIYITDADGTTLRINEAFTAMTDIRSDEIVGRRVDDLVNSGVYNRAVSLQVMERKQPVSLTETLPNGREVLLTGRPVFNDDGELFRIVTTLRDLDELNRMQKELSSYRKETDRYKREVSHLRSRQMKLDNIVIADPVMRQIMDLALQLSEVDTTVLITGESGVGKEIVTRAIHQGDSHKERPFITANCAAIPESLLESELFGYEKGAFTGADRAGKPGLFELADGGTIFLDEIGELDLNVQVKLLRVIQEREIVRVGGRKPLPVDVRIISATNRNLESMVDSGSFRKDLYYRLSVVPLHVPPVREHPACILPLVQHFLDRYNNKFGRTAAFSEGVLRQFEACEWLGNVREIENTVERMVVLSRDDIIGVSILPDSMKKDLSADLSFPAACYNEKFTLKEAVACLERDRINRVYSRCRSTRKAARELGLSQPTLVRKMAALGIEAR